jgi:hypothetical protein
VVGVSDAFYGNATIFEAKRAGMCRVEESSEYGGMTIVSGMDHLKVKPRR